MHANMKFRMHRRYCYECDVPHPLSLNGKYHMFCARKNKQSRVYKIGVHYDLQNSSMFPLEVNCLGHKVKSITQSMGVFIEICIQTAL